MTGIDMQRTFRSDEIRHNPESNSQINFCDIARSYQHPGRIQAGCLTPFEQSGPYPLSETRKGCHDGYSLYFNDSLSGFEREAHMRKDLLNARAMYGPNSLEVADRLIKLGDACEQQSKSSESENYYQQAARIAGKFSNSQEAGEMLLDLSFRAEKHGKQDESAKWSNTGRKIILNAYGFENVPETK